MLNVLESVLLRLDDSQEEEEDEKAKKKKNHLFGTACDIKRKPIQSEREKEANKNIEDNIHSVERLLINNNHNSNKPRGDYYEFV